MAGTAGVPEVMSGLVAELPWGDTDGIEAVLRGREGDLAAIIIEPVQGAGGVRAPEPGFLDFLRAFTERVGALLIFDEIISFRVAPGGAQERFGVRPDLTTLGKIIGGGYPLAAFGGREDVMAIFDARRPGAVSHGGTFNGSPVAAAAGLATLRELTPDTYARLDALGARLGAAIAAGIEREGIDARVAVVGSLFQVFRRCRRDGLRDRRRRRPDALPRPPARGLLPRAAGHGRDRRDRHRGRRRRPGGGRRAIARRARTDARDRRRVTARSMGEQVGGSTLGHPIEPVQ